MTKQDITHTESPTVKQIRIAFEQTPSKLRAAEQGWRERRKEITKRIQPVQTSRMPEKGLKVGHQAEYPAVKPTAPEVVVSARPTTSPPTPPQTPPAGHGPPVQEVGRAPTTSTNTGVSSRTYARQYITGSRRLTIDSPPFQPSRSRSSDRQAAYLSTSRWTYIGDRDEG
jgi:hypothetical protein